MAEDNPAAAGPEDEEHLCTASPGASAASRAWAQRCVPRTPGTRPFSDAPRRSDARQMEQKLPAERRARRSWSCGQLSAAVSREHRERSVRAAPRCFWWALCTAQLLQPPAEQRRRGARQFQRIRNKERSPGKSGIAILPSFTASGCRRTPMASPINLHFSAQVQGAGYLPMANLFENKEL